MEKIKAFWQRLNDRRTPLGKGFRTFYQVFIPLFAVSLVGFFGQVQEWAQCVTDCKSFPDPGVLGKALTSAFAGGMGAVWTYLQNLGEDNSSGRSIIDAEPVAEAGPVGQTPEVVMGEGRTQDGATVPVAIDTGVNPPSDAMPPEIGYEVADPDDTPQPVDDVVEGDVDPAP